MQKLPQCRQTVFFLAVFVVGSQLTGLFCGESVARDKAKPRSIPDDIWPSDKQPLLKIHPHFNDPDQIKYRLTLAATWKTHTPLAYAFAQGDRAMARVLLKQGADPNELVKVAGTTPVSTLQAAIRRREPEAVEFLLKVGATPNADHLTDVGRVQATEAQIEMTRLLLKSGVPAPSEIVVNQFASSAAPEAFALLFKHGAKVTNKVGSFRLQPTLLSAIADTEKVRIALQHEADPNQGTHHYNETPLHACSRRGNTATVDLLVASGADVNAKNFHGATPIEIALVQTGFRSFYQKGDTTIVKTLLRHGARKSVAAEVATGNVKALRKRRQNGEPIVGLTPLDEEQTWFGHNESRSDLIAMAVSFGQPASLKWLLEIEIRETSATVPDRKTDRRDSPALVTAAYQGDVRSVELLLKYEADPNEQSPRSVYVAAAFAPLHAVFAAASGSKYLHVSKGSQVKLSKPQRKIIKLLVEHGADPDLKNGYGLTPREFARTVLQNENLFDPSQ